MIDTEGLRRAEARARLRLALWALIVERPELIEVLADGLFLALADVAQRLDAEGAGDECRSE